MSVYVIVIIQSKQGQSNYIKQLLYNLVNESRCEKACLKYDLHQSLDDENTFIIDEEWLDLSWFNLHAQQEHVSNFLTFCENVIENKVIIHRTGRIA